MALTCKWKKPASTRTGFARCMTARNFRWRAAPPSRRPSPPPPTSLTRPDRFEPGFCLLESCLLKPRLLLQPAVQQFDVADVGAKHHVEGVSDQRHRADHAIQRHIAEHPHGEMPGRAERARLAHQPKRDRGGDD